MALFAVLASPVKSSMPVEFERFGDGTFNENPDRLGPGGSDFVSIDVSPQNPQDNVHPPSSPRISLPRRISAFNQEQSGVKFVGIGYNLLTGNPEGGSYAMGGVDPGLHLTRKIFNISEGDDPREIIMEDRHSCVNVRNTYVYYGTKSYQEKLKRAVTSSGKL